MAETSKRWTAAEVLELTPDDYVSWPRHEVVDGELLVSPAPHHPHQEAVKQLLYRIDPYVQQHHLGWAMFAPVDIQLDAYTLVQPDLFVAPLFEGRMPRRRAEIPFLLLAAEVLSPSTARFDRATKRRRYRRAGAAEYWVVDLDARTIERSTPRDDSIEVLSETLIWQPDAALPPLTIDLLDYFGVVDATR